MKSFVKQNILQWHRDQRERALKENRIQDAAHHAAQIKALI